MAEWDHLPVSRSCGPEPLILLLTTTLKSLRCIFNRSTICRRRHSRTNAMR